jgi:hypothetical protein
MPMLMQKFFGALLVVTVPAKNAQENLNMRHMSVMIACEFVPESLNRPLG